MLWAELQETQTQLEWLQSQYSGEKPEDAQPLLVIEQCFNNLELARDCIIRRKHRWQWYLENNTLFWELIHQIDADVLLLLPPPRLEARALEVLEEFRRNIKELNALETWLGKDGETGPLPQAVRRIGELSKSPGGLDAVRELEHARYVLRAGLRAVNSQTDRTYRQLTFNMLMRDLSGILLVLLAVGTAALFTFPHLDPFATTTSEVPNALPLVLLGAIGMIITNMLSDSPLLVASGPTRRQIIYHLFMRPIVGAFAAFFLYVTARSEILFHIISSEMLPKEPVGGSAPIHIVLGSARAVQYAYAVLSVACGYSAEKVLRSTMDRVLSKLFDKAEKDKETPASLKPEPKENEQPVAA